MTNIPYQIIKESVENLDKKLEKSQFLLQANFSASKSRDFLIFFKIAESRPLRKNRDILEKVAGQRKKAPRT